MYRCSPFSAGCSHIAGGASDSFHLVSGFFVFSVHHRAQDAGEEEVPYEARSERVSDPSWARGHLGGHQETRAVWIRIPRMRTKTVQTFQFGQ